ncbi:MAG: hypothetical protein CVV61_06695 [Tenericutes bacterium HGW-Tenericutes-6]|nr:MAG: hypothetical protein CVV61_06695 [Tenericutes bacterium HGW-Tenericutes-6]
MIVLVGASASGKTEIAKKMFEIFGYQKCVTTTTRPKRQNETDGKDYHFLDQETFIEAIKKDLFYEVSTYHNHYYGIQKKDVFDQGIVIVEPKGANTLIDKLNQEVYIVYIETSEALRQKRMLERGDSSDLVLERILFDRQVFYRDAFKKIDLIVQNEDQTIDMLAQTIHNHYQSYLKEKK